MAFGSSQITTGMLSYSLQKEFLGNGFFYREIENYGWRVYVQPGPVGQPFSSIQSGIIDEFNSRYSGDINIKIFEVPADYFFPNDSIRLGFYNVQVEVRKPILDLNLYMPEIDGAYYKGFDNNFIFNNCSVFNDFKEDFTFEQNDNGNNVYSHNLSFSLKTGSKNLATGLAASIFSNDKDTTFGIYAFVGGALLADTTNYQNYYTETYDLIRNSFSFSKKREILPVSASLYTYNLEHALNFKEDGIIDISEKGAIQGKLNFNNAAQGLDDLIGGSYGRCSAVYNKFKDFAVGTSVSDSLVNLSISTNKTLNKPTFAAEYEVNYSNNPTYSISGSTEKIINVNNDGRFIDIEHSYNFLRFISPVYSGMDADYIDLLNTAYSDSPVEISTFYTASPFYNSVFPTINRVKMSATTPNRHKNFSTSFAYTNKPTYFVTIDGTTYPFFECNLSDAKPVDIVTEYKIINRPTKNSLINYAYQTEKGSKNLQITAQLTRVADIFNAPLTNIGAKLSSLYRFGLEKTLSTFFGIDTFALSYHLTNVKYALDNNNELKLDIVIDYTLKKYTA